MHTTAGRRASRPQVHQVKREFLTLNLVISHLMSQVEELMTDALQLTNTPRLACILGLRVLQPLHGTGWTTARSTDFATTVLHTSSNSSSAFVEFDHNVFPRNLLVSTLMMGEFLSLSCFLKELHLPVFCIIICFSVQIQSTIQMGGWLIRQSLLSFLWVEILSKHMDCLLLLLNSPPPD